MKHDNIMEMRQVKHILAFTLFCLGTLCYAQSTKDNAKLQAIEKHYEYLENEMKAQRDAIQKENEAYRKFIQEERVAHREFIEYTIKIGGGFIALVLGILTFWGFDTFKGIRNSRTEIESIATAKFIEYKEQMDSNTKLYEAQIEEAKSKLVAAEQSYQKFINYYSSANPRTGRFVVIGNAERLQQMKKNDLYRFVQIFNMPDFIELGSEEWSDFNPANYDLVIYRSNVNEKGEDDKLESLIDLLKPHPDKPLLVYAKGQTEFIKGQTDQRLKESFFHMANTPVTLIDNTITSYRVAKMVEPNPHQLI